MVRFGDASAGRSVGRAADGLQPRRLVDHRRHGIPEEGQALGGGGPSILRDAGQQDNCQVAVSVSLACDQGSVPVAWELYLPEDWTADPKRRAQAGVPEELRFATKTQIALAQLRALLAEGAPHHCVLADAGYGVDTAFRQALSDMGLEYAVGVTSAVVVWPPGVEPLPPQPYSGVGRPPVVPRRTPRLQPMSVKALALSLPTQAFHTISWREGTNEPLTRNVLMPRLERAIVEHLGRRSVGASWLRYKDDAASRSPVVHFEYPRRPRQASTTCAAK